MRTKRKIVYYCDFCKKKSLRSLKVHEKHCTANPDRECRLCDNKSIKPIIEKYRKYFYIRETRKRLFEGWEYSNIMPVFKKKFTLKDLVNELDYICPNCILAIIRCLGLNRRYFQEKFKFNYKKALDNWWKIINDEARRQDEHDSIYY